LKAWRLVALVAVIVAGMTYASETSPPSLPAFKVESRVDLGEAEKAVTSSITIFSRTKVFDFLEKPAEVTIIDWRDQRVVLLNPLHHEQTELSFDTIFRFQERVQARALQDKDPRQRFFANPAFTIRMDSTEKELVFASNWLTYRVKVSDTVDPALIREFLRFSDVMAQLNCLLVKGSRLPHPRIKVNKTLLERNLFPEEVILINGPRNFFEWLPGRRSIVRSTHHLVLELTPQDRARLTQAEEWTQTFRRVNFIDYQAKLAAE